jgi:hypothetical protein
MPMNLSAKIMLSINASSTKIAKNWTENKSNTYHLIRKDCYTLPNCEQHKWCKDKYAVYQCLQEVNSHQPRESCWIGLGNIYHLGGKNRKLPELDNWVAKQKSTERILSLRAKIQGKVVRRISNRPRESSLITSQWTSTTWAEQT